MQLLQEFSFRPLMAAQVAFHAVCTLHRGQSSKAVGLAAREFQEEGVDIPLELVVICDRQPIVIPWIRA